MAKVIIGIHGLENKPPKKNLEQWWEAALIEGLVKNGYPVKPFKFELVYWADIMYDKPLDETISDPEDTYFLDEKYIPSKEDFIAEEHPIRKKILDFIDKNLDKLLLKEDYTLNFTDFTNTLLYRYFKDLALYYYDKPDESVKIKDAKVKIRQRVVEIIKKYKKDELLIIGHSMGSIIAYDVLMFEIPEIKIDTLITIGSPLGLPLVKSKIITELNLKNKEYIIPATPPSVRRNWYNFADLEDNVAMDYKLADDFSENSLGVTPLDVTVNNDYIYNGERNPHKSFGYLRTPEFSKVFYEFLEYRKPILWRRFYEKITRIIKHKNT